MAILDFADTDAMGHVVAVDTATVRMVATNIDHLRTLQVNRLVALQSSKAGQYLIGIVQKIVRTGTDFSTEEDSSDPDLSPASEVNTVRVALVGTLIERSGPDKGMFRRTLESVPEIDALCFKLEGDRLTGFMQVISKRGKGVDHALSLGHYTLDDAAEAVIDGNRFFQRHAVIVGSTGSGKSWTTTRLLEQAAVLPSANVILFDVHGEYSPLASPGIQHLKIAGPGDVGRASPDSSTLYLPYWLLSYDAMVAMLVDRSDANAPNQAMCVSKAVVDGKRHYLETGKHDDVLANFTIDSPVPFSLADLLQELIRLDTEMVIGSSGREKQGDFHGRLSRLIARIQNRSSDKRLAFMFAPPASTSEFGWLAELCKVLMQPTSAKGSAGGVKIIDCSEVPSDILPLVLATLTRLLFSVQQWTPRAERHPIAVVCEEAHLYIPNRAVAGGTLESAAEAFGRIAKEGRKYGVGLVVVSQRPSEVNHTVLSQCSNFVALRLSNAEDQGVIERLLPDSLGGFAQLLPILDNGEAIVVGDACLLPSRIRVSPPTQRPASATVEFWDEWSKPSIADGIDAAVHSLRCQS